MTQSTTQADAPGSRSESYRQMVSSSLLMGGSTAINIAVSIVRTKIMAILLGPAGFGLMGAFSAITDLVRSVAAMGINSSGVRQIADATAGGDQVLLARTARVLRRTGIVLGVVGALLMVLLSPRLAEWTFQSQEHALSISLLALAVLFRIVADGQGALLQGMRRVADMARVQILGALLGSAVGVALVLWIGVGGVALSLVAMAGASMLCSWWYSRKIPLSPIAMLPRQVLVDARGLLCLGFSFMCSGVLMMGAAYVVRLILIRHDGLEAAGLYAAAWTLGGLYVGIVLQAMGADFYPRLVGLVNDKERTNQLVDEQAQVSLLLAGAGVLATLTFAPLILRLFYSAEFAAATPMLRWVCMGMAMRVFTWPMGYVIVAHNNQKLFIAVELCWALVNVGLTWCAVLLLGPVGAAIAFFGSYVFHGLMLYPILRRVTGYRLSPQNLRLTLLLLFLSGSVFAVFEVLSEGWAILLGTCATVVLGFYSASRLIALVAPDRLPPVLRRFLSLLSGWRAREVVR